MNDLEKIEYVELNNCQRQDDSIIYSLASIVLPLSFGSFAVAAQFPKMRYALAGASIVLFLYWLLVAVRLSWYSSVRFHRMQELEANSGLYHHLLIRKPPDHLARKLGYRLSIRAMRITLLVVLVIGWIFVLVLMRDS